MDKEKITEIEPKTRPQKPLEEKVLARLFVLKYLGFGEKIKGSHHIFSNEGIEEILNI